MIRNNAPLHPGRVLEAIYMEKMGLNQSKLAQRCGCAEMWVRMQADFDLWEARIKAA